MAYSILTAEFDNPAASKKTQEGGVGVGHVSFWQHDMAHWRKKTDTQTANENLQMRCVSHTQKAQDSVSCYIVCLCMLLVQNYKARHIWTHCMSFFHTSDAVF